MKTIFNRGFQGGKAVTQAGQPVPLARSAQPTFGGQGPAPAPAPQVQGPARGNAAPSLPGRTPVPVIKKGSGGPACPVCRG